MGIYYDIEYIKIEDLIENFLNKLTELHNERNSEEIKKILGINKINEISHDKQNNNKKLKYISVKSNNHIKRTIDVVRYIIPEKMFVLWIDNIINLWINKINKKSYNEINMIIEKCEFQECNNLNRVINFNVDERLWDFFTLLCKKSDITISNGFKYTISNYVINNRII